MTPQERDFDFSLSVMISDIIDDCFRFDDEELTRELAKDVANERLKEALTPYSRNVIVQAYIKIMEMPFEEIVELDTNYITHWSLGNDIRIIFRTFRIVVNSICYGNGKLKDKFYTRFTML